MKLLMIMTLIGGVLSIISPVSARPVSYPDGWTLMHYNEADNSSLLVHYTIDPKTALGFRVEERTYGDHVFIGGQINHLVRRWNAPGSQANLYFKAGIGMADGRFNNRSKEIRAAGFAHISGDWENRRWFISGDLYAHGVEGQVLTGQQARIGVAPYLADFGALHTWLMVQADWKQNANELQGEEDFTLTPLLRFFKGSALLELGYSTNDEPLVNFIYRF